MVGLGSRLLERRGDGFALVARGLGNDVQLHPPSLSPGGSGGTPLVSRCDGGPGVTKEGAPITALPKRLRTPHRGEQRGPTALRLRFAKPS